MTGCWSRALYYRYAGLAMPDLMLSTPPLPCPECREDGWGGGARIGNRRSTCATCNNFAQNVMRMTRKRLKERHQEEYERIRLQVELDLYPQVIETYTSRTVIPPAPTGESS